MLLAQVAPFSDALIRIAKIAFELLDDLGGGVLVGVRRLALPVRD
jgi:hypothetical protein